MFFKKSVLVKVFKQKVVVGKVLFVKGGKGILVKVIKKIIMKWVVIVFKKMFMKKQQVLIKIGMKMIIVVKSFLNGFVKKFVGVVIVVKMNILKVKKVFLGKGQKKSVVVGILKSVVLLMFMKKMFCKVIGKIVLLCKVIDLVREKLSIWVVFVLVYDDYDY